MDGAREGTSVGDIDSVMDGGFEGRELADGRTLGSQAYTCPSFSWFWDRLAICQVKSFLVQPFPVLCHVVPARGVEPIMTDCRPAATSPAATVKLTSRERNSTTIPFSSESTIPYAREVGSQATFGIAKPKIVNPSCSIVGKENCPHRIGARHAMPP